MQKVVRERVTIAGQQYELSSDDVLRAMKDRYPEPLRDHYVVIADRRFPPKQVLAATTGVDRADFTSHQARSILMRLGFATDRLRSRVAEAPAIYATRAVDPEIEAFRRAEQRMWDEELIHHEGKWVLIKDFHVIYSHEDPEQALRWARENEARSDAMFRVGRPGDPIYGVDDKFID